jgi:putative transposase
MIAFIDRRKDRFGVEPICRVLPIAPSTYHNAHRRPATARAVRDSKLKAEIARIHAEHFGVYGARKLWRQLHREGITVARCTVERLMGELDLEGVRRGKARRTTHGGYGRCSTRGSGGAGLLGGRAEPAVGRGSHLGGQLGRLCRCGLGHRRVLPVPRGLAGSRSLRTDLALDAL